MAGRSALTAESAASPEELLEQFIIPNVKETGRNLGHGSYGTVLELEAYGIKCAGKKIHANLIDPSNDGVGRLLGTYRRECQLMSHLRHPHLVQYLGVCFLPQVPYPVLVMEKLHSNLDTLLEGTPNIPLPLKCSILIDVSRGLVYLHHQKPSPVIHRDLSAKNVLLTESLEAKISDLGNSRIVQLQPAQLARTLTTAPGTLVYMPPEAFGEKAVYGCSLDVFSFGHLALYTLIQEFPGNLPAATQVDPNSPGSIHALTELERRSCFMQSLCNELSPSHPLVGLVTECLHNDPNRRPCATDILGRLIGVQQQLPDHTGRMTKLEMMQRLKDQEENLQGMADEVAELKRENEELRERLSRSEALLRQGDEELRDACKEHQQSSTQSLTNNTARMANPTLALQWKECCEMQHATEHPSAVLLQGKVYMGGGWSGESGRKNTAVTVYEPQTGRWDPSPLLYKTEYFGMAVMCEKLVLVGGRDPRSHKESQDIAVWDPSRRKWLAPYSKLRRACYLPTVVGYRRWLIVAGGGSNTGTVVKAHDLVDILDTETNGWYTAPPLPMGCIKMSHAILNGTLYLLGGWMENTPVREVLTVPLDSLIVTALSHKPEGRQDYPELSLWQMVPAVPLGCSTPLVFQGSLLAIGGKHTVGEGAQAKSDIYRFEQGTGRWVLVDYLPSPLYWCAAITLPSGSQLLVLGGRNARRGSRARFPSVTMGSVATD